MKRSLFFSSLLLLASCGQHKGTELSQHRLAINIGGEPRSFCPAEAGHVIETNIARMLFDGLTRVGPSGKAELALAESVEIDETQLVYRFNLRPALWSDGVTMRAQDFVLSWREALQPGSNSTLASLLYILHGAEKIKKGEIAAQELGARAIDDSLLEITLERPISDLLERLAQPVFFASCHRMQGEFPVVNGPFRPTAWERGSTLYLERNEDYWDAASVKIEKVELCVVEENTELMLFERGELDWVGSPLGSISIDALRHLLQKGDLQRFPFLGTSFLRSNTSRFPASMKEARRALSLALDREELVQMVAEGLLEPTCSLIPLALRQMKEPSSLNGDALEAKRLWSQVAPKNVEFKMIYRMGGRGHRIAQAIQQRWRQVLGVTVQLQPLESGCYFQALRAGDFDFAFCDWIADVAEEENFLELFSTREHPGNRTGWENSEYRELIELLQQPAPTELRESYLVRCEEILAEEMPVVPLFEYVQFFMRSKDLSGVVMTPLGGFDLKWAEKR